MLNVVSKILEFSVEGVKKRSNRNERTLRVLQGLGLASQQPESSFESIYVHALIEFGIDRPKATLDFFKRPQIQQAYCDAFEKDDPAILYNEANKFIEWRNIGGGEYEVSINHRDEFAAFTLVFHEMISRSRTPAELQDSGKLDQILRLIQEGNQQKIRAKNIEMIQGTLPDQLKAWFKTLNYSIQTYEKRTTEYWEWIVNVPIRRRSYDRILVRFIESQAERIDVEKLRDQVRKHDVDEGWLVASHRVSPSAIQEAEKDDKVECYTFDALLDEDADFSRYFKWLENFVLKRQIHTDYISLACKRDVIDEESKKKQEEEVYAADQGWIEGYIDRWLDDPCKEHISVLGEFGTGKTWFAHHYAYQMMLKYREAKKKGLKRPRLPLVIQLRDYSKALNSESLFSDFFFRKHEIPLPGYSAFKQLNRMGRLLLIFDGFDEMADKLDR